MEKMKNVIVKGAFIIIVFSMLSFLSNNSASIPLVDNGLNQMNSVSNDCLSEIQSQTSFTLDIKDYPKLSRNDYVDALVTFKDGLTVDLVGVEVKYNYENLNGFSAKISTAMYNHLQNAWYVNSIHENGLVYAAETLDWGVDYINAERVWGGVENAINTYSNNLAGRTIKVAVLDTGIDTDHEDLEVNYDSGYDYVNTDSDPTDDNGHGTHCSGIIGAVDNSIGVIGVAPRVSLYAVKILGESGSGTIANVIAGINWAITNDMDVISMSLSTTTHFATFEDACDDAYDAGIVVVAAAGNDNHNSINYPARYDSVIAVGAIDSSSARASFSNYGDELEIVAPGVEVYSTMPEYSCYLTQHYGYSTDYDHMSGTSMATPMVAAVAALLLSVKPDLTNVQVRTILQETAVDLGISGWDQYFGYGSVNALAVLEYAAYMPFRENGSSYDWLTSDYSYDKIVSNFVYDGRTCLKHYEDTTHHGNYMLAEGPIVDLTYWNGNNDLSIQFIFRAQSNFGSSSVTQFKLMFYDLSTNSYLTFTNPTSYNQYTVTQTNRNGQSWISGKDSGWQTVSFNLVTSEFSAFAGTSKLQVHFGHYDSWSADWFQREYLDYLYIEEQVTPNAPRNLNGLDNGVDAITLTWQSPTNLKAAEYKIYRYKGGSWILMKTITHTGSINSLQQWTNNGLSQNVLYQYRVYAVNSVGVMGPYAYWCGSIGIGPT